MGTYLEQYLDLLKTLPNDLSRNLNLIGILDQRVESVRPHLDQTSEEAMKLLNTKKNLNSEEVHSLFNLLDARRLKELEMFDVTSEKIMLVEQAEETINSYLERLDEDLKKFEVELGPEAVQTVLEEEKAELRAEKDKDRSEVQLPRTVSHSISLADLKIRKGVRQTSSHHLADDRFEFGGSMFGVSGGVGRMHADHHKSRDDRGGLFAADDDDGPPVIYAPPRLPKPGEDVYCYCQMISDGEMIACDNKNCKIEWFHIQCLGLKKVPKGTWYCDQCKAQLGM